MIFHKTEEEKNMMKDFLDEDVVYDKQNNKKMSHNIHSPPKS